MAHYYLKNTSGILVLVVVGTEKNIRHMFYVDAHIELVNVYTKWRIKREVAD